jgi:DNA-binding NarL/FixJ family response regulator
MSTELTTRILIADGVEAIGKAIETKPNVVVLDYSMPRINGLEATRQIRARLPKTEVLMFTAYDDEKIIEECLKAGARGYLLKSDLEADLISAIEALGARQPFLTAKVTESLLASFLTQPTGRVPVLNHRERDMVQLIAQGYTSRQIANVLNISSRTVDAQRAILNRKLDTTTSASIVRYAIRNGLIEP